MARLKVLSGNDVMDILSRYGFVVSAQRGSHVKMKRTAASGLSQVLTIPMHKELDRGTLRAIYRQILLYIPQSDLRNHFYSE